MLFKDKLKGRKYEDGPITMAFIGDSVTQGFFESRKSMHGVTDYESVYHNQFKKELEFLYPQLVFNTINAGVGGDMAYKGVKRFECDVLLKKPDLIVICYGLNDINCEMEQYINSLETMFNMSKECDAQTVFMTPNMLNTYVSEFMLDSLKEYANKTAQYQTDGTFDSYIKEAKVKAIECGITVCDCYKKWKILYNSGVDTTMLLANNINHPVRKMHKLFSNSLFDTLFI